MVGGRPDRLLSVRTPRWRLVAEPYKSRAALYDRAKDPRERVNVAAQHPEVVERLVAQIVDWRATNTRLRVRLDSAPAEQSLDPATLEELRALGYLDDRSAD